MRPPRVPLETPRVSGVSGSTGPAYPFGNFLFRQVASGAAPSRRSLAFASVTVRFVSEQINVLRGAEGQIIDGNPNEVQKVVDLWTFRRDTKSGDPNWLLIKTESEG